MALSGTDAPGCVPTAPSSFAGTTAGWRARSRICCCIVAACSPPLRQWTNAGQRRRLPPMPDPILPGRLGLYISMLVYGLRGYGDFAEEHAHFYRSFRDYAGNL